MAEKIQELGGTGKRDPRRERNWREAMQILAEVKEEYGERGLGLTFVYAAGMRVSLDFGHPEEVLRLFEEVSITPHYVSAVMRDWFAFTLSIDVM